jgi:protoporphyrinogen oxidase
MALLMRETHPIVVIGAGPAGLAAAYLLAKNGREVCVLEADPRYVGGISKTVEYKGFHFDIGGHRFFSKSNEVEEFWTEILPDDMLVRDRSSRVYYRGRFFSYPLRPLEALQKLGPIESLHCVLSYFWARLRPIRPVISFEDWVVNEFGRRLFEIFFKTYTEKVWGMSCKEISAEWAAQRIKGLSLMGAVRSALRHARPPKDRSKVVKTLIGAFRYPRRGPGMLWEECARKIRGMGGKVLLDQRVTACSYDADRAVWTVTTPVGAYTASHVISSAPLSRLVQHLSPAPSDVALAAAGALRYRDFLTVALMLRDTGRFPDNWIYIHDPSVRVGRIQNFKSWSPEMVPDPAMTCYGLEYFCFEGDGLWSSSDEKLMRLATRELEQIGLASAGDIVDGYVVRQKKAYPVYDADYRQHVAVIRTELESRYPGLSVIGRNGMHKYNNQDHAVMTGLLAAKNILAGSTVYDLWRVNEDAEYLEHGVAGAGSGTSGLRMVPGSVQRSTTL